MSKDTLAQSTAYLKQALPLMIKYHVPTTPDNYHLWYSYVSASIPELNKAIDQAITSQGVCPPTTCEKLYQRYLAAQDEQELVAVKLNLNAMVNELDHCMQDALSDTSLFQNVLDKSVDQLSKIDNECDDTYTGDTVKILRDLVRESREMRLSTIHFRSQLNHAEQEIKELRTTLEMTLKLANEDPLTNLLNRRAFDLELEALIHSQHPFSLILADIDRFKNFNDEYGHPLGDQVLRIFSKRLLDACQEGITAYRLGGEEFAMLVPHPLPRARQLAENMRRAIERMSILDRKSGRRIDHITASFGVGEYNGQESCNSLFERIDKQLYKAKELGRNRVMPLPA